MPCKIKLYRAFDFISLFCGEKNMKTSAGELAKWSDLTV